MGKRTNYHKVPAISSLSLTMSAPAPPIPSFPSWWSSLDCVLLDCDGVLWAGAEVVPGAPAAVEAFRASGKQVFFVVSH